MKSLESSSAAAWDEAVLITKLPKYKQTRLWVRARQTWLGEISRASKKFSHEMWKWLSYEKVSLPTVARLAEAIALLQTRGFATPAVEPDAEAPIFLLSTGARAGSTLLQRILVTDPRLLLWGEPLGEMALLSRLTEMVSLLEQPMKLLTWKNQVDANSSALSQSRIANLYPSITY